MTFRNVLLENIETAPTLYGGETAEEAEEEGDSGDAPEGGSGETGTGEVEPAGEGEAEAEEWEEDFARCDANDNRVLELDEANQCFFEICWAACTSPQ